MRALIIKIVGQINAYPKASNTNELQSTGVLVLSGRSFSG